MNCDCRAGNGFTEERTFGLVEWGVCRGKTGIGVSRKEKNMGSYDTSGT